MSRLDTSYGVSISFADAPSIKMWEKSVTPPSVSHGGAIDTSTLRNVGWRTKNPKVLKDMGESSATVAYDPAIYDDIMDVLGTNQLITVTHPNGDTWAFWGWIDSFQAGEMGVDEEQPTATITIIASNQNASGAEVAPVFAAFVE